MARSRLAVPTMRAPLVSLFVASALALTASAGPVRADDGGADAGTGGGTTTGTGAGTTGSGGAAPVYCPGASPDSGIDVCASTTSDNLGCAVARPGSSKVPAGALALAALALGALARRRSRWRAKLASSAVSIALFSAAPAGAQPPPGPPPPPPAPPPAPAPVAPPSPAASSPPPSLYTTPADAHPVEEHPSRFRFGFGGNINTDYFRAPVDVQGFSAFIELGMSEEPGAIWAPLVRITGTRSSGTSATDSMSGLSTPSAATFTWLLLAADFCPVQASLVRRLWFRPCLRVSGGQLGAAGTVNGMPYGEHRPWVSAGLLGRLQWRPAGPLFFEAQGGAAYAFTHTTLSLAADGAPPRALPDLVPAQFEPFGGVGLGLTFP
jgi:hypothetical protein